jgi:hypothetical protein
VIAELPRVTGGRLDSFVGLVCSRLFANEIQPDDHADRALGRVGRTAISRRNRLIGDAGDGP